MPRIMAPPPSGEFNITLVQPFSTGLGQAPAKKIEIIGEPNRDARIQTTEHHQKNVHEGRGTIATDDVRELMSLVNELRGYPSDPSKDIYGQNTRLELATFEVQWGNGEDNEAEVNELSEESKDTFKRVVQSIEALTRQTAKPKAL